MKYIQTRMLLFINVICVTYRPEYEDKILRIPQRKAKPSGMGSLQIVKGKSCCGPWTILDLDQQQVAGLSIAIYCHPFHQQDSPISTFSTCKTAATYATLERPWTRRAGGKQTRRSELWTR